MLPNIGLDVVGKLPIVGDIVEGKEGQGTDAVLGKALEKVAKKDPDLVKELAFALTDAVKPQGKDGDDGKMPKELEGLLKGALDIAAGMIPGGNIIKGVLGKIF